MNRLSLTVKMVLVTVLILVVGIGMSFLITEQALRQVRESELEAKDSLAHIVSDLLDGVLKNSLEEMTEYVEDLGLQSQPGEVAQAIRRIERAFNIAGLKSSIEEAFFVDAAGKMTGSFLNTPAETARSVFPDLWSSIDLKKRKVYGEPKALAGKPIVFLSAPLGKGEGALVIGALMTEEALLSSFTLHDWMVDQTGFIEVIDQHGDILARSKPKQPPPVEVIQETERLSRMVGRHQAVVGACQPCHDGDKYEVKYLTAFVPMEQATWALVLRQSYDEVMAPVLSLRNMMILLSGLVLVFAVALVWVITRNVVVRISRLQEVSAAMEKGNLDAAVPQAGHDEIGKLAEGLDTMRIALKQAQADVKREAREASEARARSETDRLKSEFLASMAHQLRTPLTSVMGYTSSLLREDILWNDQEKRKFLTQIELKADELDGLISKLLQAARVEGKAIKLALEPVLLPKLTEEVIDSLSVSYKRHIFKAEFPNNFPIVKADAAYMAQALWNLVENAAKYSPDGGHVTVFATESADGVVVGVKDEGIGIAPEHVDKLFSRFYRVDDKTNRMVTGTGLGLYVAKALVEAHGGKVWVESEPSKGSTFYLSLPLDSRLSRRLEDE